MTSRLEQLMTDHISARIDAAFGSDHPGLALLEDVVASLKSSGAIESAGDDRLTRTVFYMTAVTAIGFVSKALAMEQGGEDHADRFVRDLHLLAVQDVVGVAANDTLN